jgi:hypothetical protein
MLLSCKYVVDMVLKYYKIYNIKTNKFLKHLKNLPLINYFGRLNFGKVIFIFAIT